MSADASWTAGGGWPGRRNAGALAAERTRRPLASERSEPVTGRSLLGLPSFDGEGLTTPHPWSRSLLGPEDPSRRCPEASEQAGKPPL